MQPQRFQLDGEHETPKGWLYTFTLHMGAEPSHHELTLSWVDHEHLVGGSIAPEHIARAVFMLAVEVFGAEMPPKFDVSTLRRRVDGFDERVRATINAPL